MRASKKRGIEREGVALASLFPYSAEGGYYSLVGFSFCFHVFFPLCDQGVNRSLVLLYPLLLFLDFLARINVAWLSCRFLF